jgi:hypothetical protein
MQDGLTPEKTPDKHMSDHPTTNEVIPVTKQTCSPRLRALRCASRPPSSLPLCPATSRAAPRSALRALPPSTSPVVEGEAREACACAPSSAPVGTKERPARCAWSVCWTVALHVPLTRACLLLEFPNR